MIWKTPEEAIAATRWMNDGAGLIVPPAVAKALRDRGITEGFTEQKKIPLSE